MPKKVTCQFCNDKYGCKQIYKHYDECLASKNQEKNGYLVLFNSNGITGQPYFIYAIIGSQSKFSNIDKFLRDTWCECCSHLSNFVQYIDPTTQMEFGKTRSIAKFKEGDRFIYDYDFGSTTKIFIEIVKKLEGNREKPNSKIEIIYRNENPDIKCQTAKCKNNAKYYICYEPYCLDCVDKNNDSDADEMKLLIVNSPRSGECGYE